MVLSHKALTEKQKVIIALKGLSCLSCKYRISDNDWTSQTSRTYHCSLHTDIDGSCREKSMLINNYPCKNHWSK